MFDLMATFGMAFTLGLLTLVTVIIVVSIWQFATTQRAKASIAREEAYRKLAEESAKTQAEIAEALKEMRPQLAAIEKLLREVE
jgi:ABC-type dipeptide/oligopeptide/nickel transport system permease subunit